MILSFGLRFALTIIFISCYSDFAAAQGPKHAPVADMPGNCIHLVPKGSKILEDGLTVLHPDNSREVVNRCATPEPLGTRAIKRNSAPPTDGSNHQWVEWGEQDNASGFSYLNGTWVVPKAPPSNDGQVLYLWNGLEPRDTSCVIQPVLGWNAFDDNAWTITSWICCSGTSTGCYYSNPVDVNVGDTIQGTMTLQNGNWNIDTADVSIGESTQLIVSNTLAAGATNNAPQTQSYFLLETYFVPNCEGYSASNPMTYSNSIYAQNGVAGTQVSQFYPVITVNDGCHENVTTPPGGVSLYVNSNPSCGRLEAGGVLYPGQTLSDCNGLYHLTLQYDGNLVESTWSGALVWATYTNSAAFLVMQQSGNLVLYDADGQPVWFNATYGIPGSTLAVQSDGNVVIGSGSMAIWSWMTGQLMLACGGLAPNEEMLPSQYIMSCNLDYRLIMQADGNLVLYHQGTALWNSATYWHPGAHAIMQGDGNLVVSGPVGRALFNTQTYGHPGGSLAVRDDGKMVIKGPRGRALWNTRTE
jgi:hypothetical protein